MADNNDSLQQVRREIDEIDNAIHDLLIRRTQIVERVTELKKGQAIKIRPAREAQIIYRLMERHRGGFPRRELVRIWRELIVATLGFEGPFSVAVYAPRNNPGFWQVARNHFGSHTQMTGYPSQRRALEAVRTGVDTVGILPRPQLGETDPWWRHLVSRSNDVPRVIGRLPFVEPAHPGPDDLEALVICQIRMEPSGRDASLLGLEGDDALSSSRLHTLFEAADLSPGTFHHWTGPKPEAHWFGMTEVDGFVDEDDPRLIKIAQDLKEHHVNIVALGGYARPLSAKELDG